MKNYHRLITSFVALLCVAAAPQLTRGSLNAQSMADRLKAKAKERADAAADKGLDDIANAVKCVATDAACIKKATDSGKPVTVTNAKGQKVSTADSAKAMKAAGAATSEASSASPAASSAAESTPTKQTDSINVNFDFIPGDKVIYYEDFANDRVGDLPEHLNIREGNFAIVDKGGRHALMSASGGFLEIKLPTILPDRYTIETEYRLPTSTNFFKWTLDKDATVVLSCGNTKTAIDAYLGDASKSSSQESETEPPVALCRYMMDKGYAKAYFGGMRTAQLNGLPVKRTDLLKIEIPGTDKDDPFMLYSIRIAAGGKPLWDAISATGRVAVSGILFDTGSDHIRAESTPVLKEIAALLRDHADLKLLVEGHTDNVGAPAANLSLSDRRAAAVKTWLVNKEQVNAARLTTKGLGDTKPAAPNTSPEGRQNNRRVELVKQP